MSMVMHLAEAKPGQLTTRYKHYYIERPCRILVIGEHLKTKTTYRCLLRHISIGGAMLDINAAVMLPKNFFLEIEGFREEIGCSQVHRYGSELGVRFNMQLASEFLSRLIRLDFKSGLL
ncbi:PilZ domain-containing protein [Pararhizobium gei]|uniref:PilZ domain-containing protein n=1 Tax=Pararhizobium gei TaxID=1395951 RepID=UPI0023D9C34A|nr:PilZ domain-containing protein [Rhizobium gei]